ARRRAQVSVGLSPLSRGTPPHSSNRPWIADAAALLQANLPTSAPDWALSPIQGLFEECGGVPLLSGESPTET
ncbi:MAG: hypothetical protein AAF192_18990, partial [Pseudomonadota bacterium]